MRQAISVIFHALQSSVQEVQQAHQEKQRNESNGAHGQAAELPRNHSLAGVTHFKNASTTTTITAGRPGSSDSSLHHQHQGCTSCSAEDASISKRRTSTRWQSHTRLASAFFGFVAMCSFAAACAHTNKYYENVNGGGDWTDGFALVAPLLSIFLNPLVIVRNLWKKRTTHHTLRIAIDTIIFVLGLVSLIYAIAGSIIWYWQDAIRNDDGSIECASPLNAFSPECAPVAYKIGHEQIAGAVFLGLLDMCQLSLGIAGVVAWAKERNCGQDTDEYEMDAKSGGV